MSPSPSIVIAAGGTGGHIYPGLALAGALRRREPDSAVSFVGTRRGLEGRLVPGAGWRLHYVDMIPFSRTLGAKRFLLPLALARSAVQARRILRQESASVAVGMGGYASIPLIAGARLAGLPSIIHESGAVAGRANKVAARLTRHVATAFDEAVATFPRSVEARTVGMPLGPAITEFDQAALRDPARAELGLSPEVAMVLVNGGSQGSVRLNETAVGLARRWQGRDDVRLVIKAGQANADEVARQLKVTGGDAVATSVAYFDRIDHAYAAADLTLCRAGAGTVAELALVGLPAVLVPYPYAPNDHQAVNAGVLVKAGAGLMVRDHDATAERLGPLVEDLLDHREKLEAMRTAARAVARPRAAEELADWVLELAAGARSSNTTGGHGDAQTH